MSKNQGLYTALKPAVIYYTHLITPRILRCTRGQVTNRCQGLFLPHPFFKGKALGTRLPSTSLRIDSPQLSISKFWEQGWMELNYQEETFENLDLPHEVVLFVWKLQEMPIHSLPRKVVGNSNRGSFGCRNVKCLKSTLVHKGTVLRKGFFWATHANQK